MPILAKEASFFPESLFIENDWEPLDRQWYLVYTKSRQEKALSRDLFTHEIPYYLPLVAQDRLIRGKKVSAYLPLFSNYLFLCGNHDELGEGKKTNRILCHNLVSDQEKIYSELQNINRIIEAEVPVTIENKLQPGQRVQVLRGPFAGVEGEIIRRKRKTLLVVKATILQQGVSIEIDDCAVEPIR